MMGDTVSPTLPPGQPGSQHPPAWYSWFSENHTHQDALWPCQAEAGNGVAHSRQPHPDFLQTSEPRTKGRGRVQTKMDKNSWGPGPLVTITMKP